MIDNSTLQARIRSRLAEERKMAEAQISASAAHLEEIIESTRFVATDDEHDPDGSTVAFERSKASALLSHSWARLAEADSALNRMEVGTYGVCQSCGEPIDAERLLARPVAIRCVGCAEAEGRGRRRRR
jgi:DnaK suppressor protein